MSKATTRRVDGTRLYGEAIAIITSLRNERDRLRGTLQQIEFCHKKAILLAIRVAEQFGGTIIDVAKPCGKPATTEWRE